MSADHADTAWAPAGVSAHEDHFVAEHLSPPDLWARIDYASTPELAAYPSQMNAAALLLDRQATAAPDRTCMISPDSHWSYGQALAKCNQIARVLVEDLGVRPGHRVLLRSANNPIYALAILAVFKVGAVAVPTIPMLRARELTFIANKARVNHCLCDLRLREALEDTMVQAESLTPAQVIYFSSDDAVGLEARMATKAETFTAVDTAADDPALICFTSGTTGEPKGCVHFHRDILAICDTFSRHTLQTQASDVIAGTPPLAFAFGFGALIAFPLHAGAAVYLQEAYTPDSLVEAIVAHNITTISTAPTLYRAATALAAKTAMPSLRCCVSAGEPLPKPVWEGWCNATGIRIIDGIGTSEMLHIFIACAGDAIRPGATGKPVPGYEACLLDDTGGKVSPGIVGRLAVRGPTACRYLDNEERQRAYAQYGWNLTGDAYIQDEDGYYWYQARTDDMIISAGYNISGLEIEAVLLEHADVAECAVIGAPDAERGQVVKAVIVLRDGAANNDAAKKALQEYVKATVAPYKYPRLISFVDSLPRTQTGKVQRYLLRQQS